MTAPSGEISCYSETNRDSYAVLAEGATGSGALLEAPGGVRPKMLAASAGVVESGVRSSTRELNQAVARGEWHRADRAAERLKARLTASDTDQLSDAARDEIHLSLSSALGAAERANAWSTMEIILGIFALGIPFLVDALTTTDVERLGDIAADARRQSARAMASKLVGARSGAGSSDAAAVERELELLPPAILRVLTAEGVRVYAVHDNIFAGMDVKPEDLPPDARDYSKILGVTDSTTKTVNVRTQDWDIGGAKVPRYARMNSSTVLHEAMHAYDDKMHCSSSRAFLDAMNADSRALSAHEAQPDPAVRARESFAETCARYLEGDHAMESQRPALWRYCLVMFGPR